MERLYLRLEKKQKKIFERLAKNQGMTIADYMRYKLIDQNPDVAESKDLYHCPSGEHYNYVIACFAKLNFLLLNSLVKKAHGKEEGIEIINKSFVDSKANLEKIYGYKKIKDKDE